MVVGARLWARRCRRSTKAHQSSADRAAGTGRGAHRDRLRTVSDRCERWDPRGVIAPARGLGAPDRPVLGTGGLWSAHRIDHAHASPAQRRLAHIPQHGAAQPGGQGNRANAGERRQCRRRCQCREHRRTPCARSAKNEIAGPRICSSRSTRNDSTAPRRAGRRTGSGRPLEACRADPPGATAHDQIGAMSSATVQWRGWTATTTSR